MGGFGFFVRFLSTLKPVHGRKALEKVSALVDSPRIFNWLSPVRVGPVRRRPGAGAHPRMN